MGEIKAIFFDTYALYELIRGNPAYRVHSKDIALMTTRLNLMELHYGYLKTQNKEVADAYYDFFLNYVLEISDEVIKKASEFKLKHAAKKLSYIDCIGYMLAKTTLIPFLTGDKGFTDIENILYIK